MSFIPGFYYDPFSKRYFKSTNDPNVHNHNLNQNAISNLPNYIISQYIKSFYLNNNLLNGYFTITNNQNTFKHDKLLYCVQLRKEFMCLCCSDNEKVHVSLNRLESEIDYTLLVFHFYGFKYLHQFNCIKEISNIWCLDNGYVIISCGNEFSDRKRILIFKMRKKAQFSTGIDYNELWGGILATFVASYQESIIFIATSDDKIYALHSSWKKQFKSKITGMSMIENRSDFRPKSFVVLAVSTMGSKVYLYKILCDVNENPTMIAVFKNQLFNFTNVNDVMLLGAGICEKTNQERNIKGFFDCVKALDLRTGSFTTFISSFHLSIIIKNAINMHKERADNASNNISAKIYQLTWDFEKQVLYVVLHINSLAVGDSFKFSLLLIYRLNSPYPVAIFKHENILIRAIPSRTSTLITVSNISSFLSSANAFNAFPL